MVFLLAAFGSVVQLFDDDDDDDDDGQNHVYIRSRLGYILS